MKREIDPKLLDLVMRESDHVVYYGDSPLQSPGGSEIRHENPRILKHLMIKLTLSSSIEPQGINSFAAFAFQSDYLENGQNPVKDHFMQIINHDKLVQAKLKQSAPKLVDINLVLDYLAEQAQVLNLIYLGASEIVTRMNNFLYEDQADNPYDANHPRTIIDFLLQRYDELPPQQQAGINLLCAYHQAGIMLPLLLVRQKISPSEYANALVAIHLNLLAENTAVDMAGLMGMPEADISFNQWDQPEQAFAYFHLAALRILEYLSFFEETSYGRSNLKTLIGSGESYHLEFKTSFRWDVHQDKKNPAVEHASLKTISAFLNSSGGNLLIGVQDDGTISGIETDRFENEDKFLLHFWNMVKSSLGQEATPYIRTTLEKHNGKTVCRVHCLRSPSPVFLRQKGFDEEFYIRIGPSSSALEIREALNYIAEHFAAE